ncbi:MAG: zinc ribbon domain-containing protein [Oscillospiraceae bacterium]|nr:zinc ribbon domain-containing protein [Oscillospiraceae bacterium]
MFCRNCGSKIEDGNVFCTQCGAAVMGADAQPQAQQTRSAPAPAQEDFVLASPTEKPVKQKKPGGKKWIAPVAILSVIAIAVVAVVLNWSAITGLFGGGMQASGNNGNNNNGGDSTKLSGVEHLNKVETNSLGGYADAISKVYGQLLKSDTFAGGAQTSLKLRVGDDVLQMLKEQIANKTGANVDLSWLSEFGLDMDVNTQDALAQAKLRLLLAGNQFLNLDLICDMDSQMLWLAFKDLSSDYLEMDFAELGLNLDTFVNSVENANVLRDALPSGETVNTLLKKYIAIALEYIGDADKETETLELDGLKQEATALTVKVTEKDLLNIVIKILEEAKNDQALKGIVEGFGAYIDSMNPNNKGTDYYAEFSDAVEDAIKNLKDKLASASTDNYIRITTYADNADSVIGRTIKVISGGETVQTLYYRTVTDGDAFRFKASVSELEITGSGTVKGNVLDGEYSVKVSDTEYLLLKISDFDQAKLERGYLSGTIRLEPSSKLIKEVVGNSNMSIFADLALELKLDTSDTAANIDIDIFANDSLLVGLTMNTKITEGGSIKKPSSKDTVNAMDEEEVKEWVQNMDFDALLRNLKAAGVPSEYVDALETMVNSMLDSMNGTAVEPAEVPA